jgi:hypothetical protein
MWHVIAWSPNEALRTPRTASCHFLQCRLIATLKNEHQDGEPSVALLTALQGLHSVAATTQLMACHLNYNQNKDPRTLHIVS